MERESTSILHKRESLEVHSGVCLSWFVWDMTFSTKKVN